MTTQRPTFTQRGGDGAGFFYLLASGGASGSINFDFTTGSLPGAITFTRPSIGTYNATGNILTTVGNDAARFNFIGGGLCLFIEPAATNILPNSNDFSLWTPFSGAVATANQFVGPDGTNNGWSVASNTSFTGIRQSGITVSNTPYALSIWAKRIVGTSPTRLELNDVNNGSVVTPGGLSRILSVNLTPTAGTGNVGLIVTTATSTNGYFGMQVEAGTVSSSYIPTTTTAVTRAADSATFTIPSGINQLTYTFDNNSTQTVSVSPGSYTIPSNLNRPNIKSIVGSA